MIRERETLMETKSASFHDLAESLRSHQSKKTKELPVSLISHYLSLISAILCFALFRAIKEENSRKGFLSVSRNIFV